jgi:hypothetical protein
MAKARRKTLPKDFDELLKTADLEALKAVFDNVDVNARGGVFKQTALAFNDCPDDLTRWLVEQGADLDSGDSYGETPLHSRSGHWQGNIAVLLELGADVNHDADGRGTPLHRAAAVGNIATAKMLLEHGADPNALNSKGQSPLVFALERCSNAQIDRMAPVAELLLNAMTAAPVKKSFIGRLLGGSSSQSSVVTPEMKGMVEKIGKNFEFHRAGFNPESVDAASSALERLYALFEVPPVARRAMYDGKSNIVAKSSTWQNKHHEFWELLVPSRGAASTVQGEVIRISGRISDELERNGGINWDADYRKMVDVLLVHFGTGNALSPSDQDSAARCVSEIKRRDGDPAELCRLAVNWVELNPKPVSLPTPEYTR